MDLACADAWPEQSALQRYKDACCLTVRRCRARGNHAADVREQRSEKLIDALRFGELFIYNLGCDWFAGVQITAVGRR